MIPEPEARPAALQERVLILAPQGRDAPLMEEALTRAEVCALACRGPAELLEHAAVGVGAVVITAEALASATIAAFNAFVNAQESWSDLSFVLLVGGAAQARGVLSLFERRCNLVVLERPLSSQTLVTVVRTALRARRRQYEVRDLLEQRQRLNERLELANGELEAFSYSVSHDLRAPLRSVSGYSEVLLEDPTLPNDQADHYLRRIRANALRMGELIDDLLKLSRISQGQLRRSQVDLAALAQRVAQTLVEQHPDAGVRFHAQACPPVSGDERLLSIVLENLLSNAWKFTRRTSLPEVTLGFSSSEKQPVYFVRDNGAGFDMNHAGRLFTPFQRLHSERDFGGTGIGLATVQRIVRKHGGKIWAEAEPGQGATFFFTLASPVHLENRPASPYDA